MSTIGDLATDISSGYFFHLTGAELTTQIANISGWLAVNLGQLNTVLYTCYTGESPDLGQEENAIFSQLYLQSYYINKSIGVLNNVTSDADWIRITEGDTTLVRTNKNEVAKSYRNLSNDAREMGQSLVTSYLAYVTQPLQVAGSDAATGSIVY